MTWLRHQYGIYVFTLSLCVGVVGATLWSIPLFVYVGIAAIACVSAAVIRFSSAWRWYGRWLLLVLAVVTVGLWRTEYVEQQLYHPTWQPPLGEAVTVTGTVMREPEESAQAQQVVIEVQDTALLLFTEPYRDIEYGDALQVTGQVAEPEPFSGEYGRIFAYDDYLAAQGVVYTMSFPAIEQIASGQGSWWLQRLYQGKDIFRQQLQQALPEPQVALGEGLLLGVKSALGEQLESAFRTTGLIHIVVLSGFNVMLVVAFIQYILSVFLPLRPRLLFAVMGIVGFALLVGLSATVVRASLMAGIYLLAQYFGRQYEAIRGLLLAAAIMVWWQPLTLLYDIGFQLSFVATLGLILVSPQLEMWFTHGPRAVAWRSYGVATIATQIATTPLLLYHIGEFSVVAPLVNMLVLPMVPVAMALTFAVGVVGLVSPSLAVWVGGLAQLPLTYIIELARLVAALPFASIWVPAFSVGWVVVAYGFMALGGYGFLRWARTKIPAGSLPTPRAQQLSAVPIHAWCIQEIDLKTTSDKKPAPSKADRGG